MDQSGRSGFEIAQKNMSHEIRWDAARQEWICTRCLRTSDHVSEQDAERELLNSSVMRAELHALAEPARSAQI